MSKVEALLPISTVKGIFPDSLATVVNVQWFGSMAMELTHKVTTWKVAIELFHPQSRLADRDCRLGSAYSFGTVPVRENDQGTPDSGTAIIKGHYLAMVKKGIFYGS